MKIRLILLLFIPALILSFSFKEVSETGVWQDVSNEQSSSKVYGHDFAENSVLSEGDWYRIATNENGIYRIGFEDLSDMGIVPSAIDPRKIRLFGNGNGIVPERNADERIDDLVENPIFVYGEEDGVFDTDDYILFYGQAPTTWRFSIFQAWTYDHFTNPYTDYTFYFLNIGMLEGARIPLIDHSSLSPTVSVTEFSDYDLHELNEVNVMKSGREWYGELFDEQLVYEYTSHFPNICTECPAGIRTNLIAQSEVNSNFDFFYGDQHLLSLEVDKVIIGREVFASSASSGLVGFLPFQGDSITIRVKYDKPESTSKGWMNYLAIYARRKLVFTGPDMLFRDHQSIGTGEVAEYLISGANSNLLVWDVTDPFFITEQKGVFEQGQFIFKAPAEELREYIAFDGSGFKTVEFIEKVQNQDLHASGPTKYIILSHPDFLEQAERMRLLHKAYDAMDGLVVTPQEVYNEFGSGKQDPAAIRDFIRMLYTRADSSNRPAYILLLGDASYDFKDRIPGNTNFIPAYQSLNSIHHWESFVTDDFYGLMDPNEGMNAAGNSVDIGIGRFPVQTVAQADEMVDKIEAYMSMKPDVLGKWQNYICFIADDENQNVHLSQAEKLQYIIDTGYQAYARTKIYLDAFPQVSSPSGDSYPDVNKAINRSIEKGCLIVNYTGHGGETGLAGEGILDIPTINSYTNWDRLPLFITATCEFSRFDNPDLISAGEYVFLNQNGGGIGIITTSRLAQSEFNFYFNESLYKYMFKRQGGQHYRLGDVIRLAKTEEQNNLRIKNIVLLGDPALKLAYPELEIIVLEINGAPVDIGVDTMKAMSEVTVKGIITDQFGNPVEDFKGLMLTSLFDKDIKLSTLGNDAGSIPTEFYGQGQELYKGKVSVIDGSFSFNFFVPKNIATHIGSGKLGFYAYDTIDYRDANGYFIPKVGSVNTNVIPDGQGPDQDLYINNTDFISGDLTGRDIVFLARLNDDQGINCTGNGFGRDISLILDGNTKNAILLNDVFVPDLDNYRSGWVSFPFSGMEDGEHSLTLKSWDNMDNSSEKSIAFKVSVDAPIALTRVMNYPNPFNDETHFVFDHNKPDNSFDVKIMIYDMNGQHIRTLEQNVIANGLSIQPMRWDGTDDGGNKLGYGVYIYRIYVTDIQGSQYVQTSKLIYTANTP